MKSDLRILVAFIMNLAFSVFEFVGGALTGSIAIASDAVHDLGDAVSIGISFFLEKKSKKEPDSTYTYGYARFSVLGSVITSGILFFGSAAVIYNAVMRIISPVEIDYSGMAVFAVAGTAVNLLAALFTRGGHSLNQRAVNLHMLEDVLGWVAVLIGALIMRFTDISVLDPILSLCVAVFILVNAAKNLREVLDLFLEKAPKGIEIPCLLRRICELDGVLSVHHVHVWSLDGASSYATMHIVHSGDSHAVKEAVREELTEHGISHAVLELEEEGEHCTDTLCRPVTHISHGHRHHHH